VSELLSLDHDQWDRHVFTRICTGGNQRIKTVPVMADGHKTVEEWWKVGPFSIVLPAYTRCVDQCPGAHEQAHDAECLRPKSIEVLPLEMSDVINILAALHRTAGAWCLGTATERGQGYGAVVSHHNRRSDQT